MDNNKEPFIPMPSPGPGRRFVNGRFIDGIFFRPRLSIRIRIWWHRRETKSWYDEYLYHQRAIEAHRRATLECIAKGNEHHQAALWLEAESKA